MNRIKLYDTTLRDGAQAEDISFSLEDKVRIALKIDELGIDYIEGGWPGANPKDTAFFSEIKKHTLKNAKIAAFGSTRRAKSKVADDENIKALLKSNSSVITLFSKAWDLHVRDALRISKEENLEMIFDSISYLKKHVDEVMFDAEHFFDGYKGNPEYAIKAIQAAEAGGADWIVLCDTNGGTMPTEVPDIMKAVAESVKLPIGIHVHNDTEMAVANSIIAVAHGATQVQGTINGYGERCGNANLCSIIPNLKFKLGKKCVTDRQAAKLSEVSAFVDEIANMKHYNHRPYVGKSAFAHKGGVHASAVMKNPKTYEHIEPELVGNVQRILVSELSGRSNILIKAKQYGVDIDSKDGTVANIVSRLKDLEGQGYQFEGADASFELLMNEAKGKRKKFFELIGFRVIVEKRNKDEEPISEATIKIKVGEKVEITAAEGNGPVNALDHALRKALYKFYPELIDVSLVDFKVRILDGKSGTEAKTRVLIESGDSSDTWGTVGVHGNIIEASWQAIVDSMDYKLNKRKK
ncbi:MAG: citramalate synthase [Nitrospinota bacterium]